MMSNTVKRRKKSAVWRLFTDINRDKKVKCLLCSQILSVANKSTCSLIRHINKKHPDKEIKRQSKNTTLNKNGLRPKRVKQLIHTTENETTEVSKMDGNFKKLNPLTAKANPLPTSTNNENSDSQLIDLLSKIDRNNYLYIFARCKECNVSARQLRYLQKEHVRELIPKSNLGTLAEFEYLFNEWKLKNGFMKMSQLQQPASAKVRMDKQTSSSHMVTENDNDDVEDEEDNEDDNEDDDDDDDNDNDDDGKSNNHNNDDDTFEDESESLTHGLSPLTIKQEDLNVGNNEKYDLH